MVILYNRNDILTRPALNLIVAHAVKNNPVAFRFGTNPPLVMLEVLNSTLVFLGSMLAFKGAEVSTFSGLGILLPRI